MNTKLKAIVVINPNYWTNLLPEEGGGTHAEVCVNYGTDQNPNWHTLKYAENEEAANKWLQDHPQYL